MPSCSRAAAYRVENLLAELCARFAEGAVLYLHCWAGQGRTGDLWPTQVCNNSQTILRDDHIYCHAAGMHIPPKLLLWGRTSATKSVILHFFYFLLLRDATSPILSLLLQCNLLCQVTSRTQETSLTAAGTIAACLLSKLYNLQSDDALALIQRAFETRGMLGNSPENKSQRQFVMEFAASQTWSRAGTLDYSSMPCVIL